MEKTETKLIVQKIRKSEDDTLSKAIRYYTILSAINDMKLTEREIQLVAFTAVRGNISYSTNRAEFCEMYNSSSPTINNIISKLKKIGILIKDGTKIKVNSKVILPFEKNIALIVTLENNG